MTPEGKVKKAIYDLLNTYAIMPASRAGANLNATGWYYAAVQGTMSVRGVPDIIGHYRGKFFAIEAKAPGKEPSGFQRLQIDAIRSSGGAVFVVDGVESLRVFDEWLSNQ